MAYQADRSSTPRGATSEVWTPTALGSKLVVQGKPQGVTERKRSKVWQYEPESTVFGPYVWEDPPTWVDGTAYGADVLTRQFITNMDQIPVALATTTENIPLEEGVNVYLPFDFSVTPGEVWMLILCVPVYSTSNFSIQITGPADSELLSGSFICRNSGGNARYGNMTPNGGYFTTNEFYDGDTDPIVSATIDLLLVCTATETLRFAVNGNGVGTDSYIVMGATLLGEKLS